MKKTAIVIIVLNIFLILPIEAQEKESPKSQNAVTAAWIRENVTTNPVNASWITKNIRKESPKLFLTKKLEEQIKAKIKNDTLIKAYYNYLLQAADIICTKPLLERKKVGRRLLSVSNEARRRISILAMVYRLERDNRYLNRLSREIDAVSGFTDWNPSHFLDVAAMSYGVAIGLDWCGEWLPDSTVEKAKSALKKHILFSFEEKDYNWWINSNHNWNQSCHGSLSASALVLADEYPELAARVISRAVDKLPIALASYSPDGAYPEGPSYWNHGTKASLRVLSVFETALGTDFNLSKVPGFMESATYKLLAIGPSGESFNYSDARLFGLDLYTQGIMTWFAQKTGNNIYLDKEKMLSMILEVINHKEEPPGLSPEYLIWLAQFKKKKEHSLPIYWKGEGLNPVAFFGAEPGENTGFYLGVKGGAASVNHGNMDVGSFIFELNGVRWSVDPGIQEYQELEETIGSSNLWDESQNSQRWSLLTKGNKFHSTLTVNDQRHNVNGFAPISEFNIKEKPALVSFDLSDVFKGQLISALRKFVKIDERTLQITDEIEPAEHTEYVTWAMITVAEVSTCKNGAILQQDDQQLQLKIIEPEDLNISVISLSPPPMSYDKKIEGLKRIEIRIPAYILNKGNKKIIVELKAKE